MFKSVLRILTAPDGDPDSIFILDPVFTFMLAELLLPIVTEPVLVPVFILVL
jgi:hypothetical protein